MNFTAQNVHTMKPAKVNRLDVAFGGRTRELLPPRNLLPDEFQDQRGPWCDLARRWFFEGLKTSSLKPKPGVNKTEAIAHCAAIMQSFEPKHEHKIGGVGFLMSLWFEPMELPGEGQVKPSDAEKKR